MIKRNRITALLTLLSLSFPFALPAATAAGTDRDDYHQRFGRAQMGISCSEEAKAPFERGLLQLHSFAWEQARGSFRETADVDPDCAMAWWGVAMSYYDGLHDPPAAEDIEAARRALARARAAQTQTARETAYIAAAAEIYAGGPDSSRIERDRAYSRAMQRIHVTWPGDHEAAAFYSLSLLSLARRGGDEDGRVLQQRAADTLKPLFDSLPRHPGIAHYLIHAYDDAGNREPGLAAARRYARIAPALRHPQHMPSHIFAGLGMWQESNAVNRVALDASPTYYHSLMYLVYGHLQLGQWQAARALVRDLRERMLSPAGGKGERQGLHDVSTRLLLETRDWEAAARARMWSEAALDTAETLYVRGVGAARSGDPGAAAAALRSLESLLARLREKGRSRSRLLLISNHASQVRGLIALARGREEDALASLREAAALTDSPAVDRFPPDSGTGLPAHEVLGEVLLALGRYGEAQEHFAAALARTPNRLHSVHGLARAAARAGDTITAREQYRALLRLLSDADAGRPETAEAQRYLSAH